MNSSIRCVVLVMAMICKMDHVAGQFVAFFVSLEMEFNAKDVS